MYNIENIKNYILFLKRECGLYITLHPHDNESIITSSELITFNIHDNPYCVFVKSFDGVWQHCVERQDKVREKCKCGSFCGSCFAGVREYVYPLWHKNELLGFISVSGYKSENSESYMQRVSKKYHIPQKDITAAYSLLKHELPSKEWIDTLILPLCNMLELAYIKTENNTTAVPDPITDILRYIKRYHSQRITLDDICKHFGCSRSYVSHLFKKSVGKGFREYLTELRIEDAKSLLEYSNLTVTEIALSVGFGDSTYFSNVFKNKIGISPSAYRKK